jgi:predicted acylesterase/phospholipase RssA
MTHLSCLALRLALLCGGLLLGGCSHLLATFNEPLPQAGAASAVDSAASAAAATSSRRATFAVDGSRGQPKALVYLSLSGGGSRAAYMSTAAMLRLARVDPEIDFLAEVDVMSAVSGGSIAAAFYAATRDESVRAPDISALLQGRSAADLAPLRLGEEGTLHCDAPLPSAAPATGVFDALPGLLKRLGPVLGPSRLDRVRRLCQQAPLQGLRSWTDASARSHMSRNYMRRWLGNLLWPTNVVKYWFTAFDRSDIMAQTLADNLFDTPVLGRDLTVGELNPTRPYLLINATNATRHEPGQPFPFGTPFTFTEEDFRDRIGSDIHSFPLARAVMSSSSFPGAFATMTMRDWRGVTQEQPEEEQRFLHVFDGGNSDNLGLRAIKRSLLQLHVQGKLNDYDRIVVLLVDAFTVPSGARRNDSDPRGLISYLVDMNITDAVDSLLQANRARLVSEFDLAELRWNDRDCRDDSRNLPRELCEELVHKAPSGVLRLSDKLVFYHLGFDDVLPRQDDQSAEAQARRGLKRALDRIPTALQLDADDAAHIDRALDHVIKPENQCLQQLRQLLLAEKVGESEVRQTRCACVDQEGRKLLELPAEPAVNQPGRALMCPVSEQRQ